MESYTLAPKHLPLNKTYQVIVVGGGPAGCAAAAAAAREGIRTLLVEATYALGGMGTLGLVPWFCGYHDREKIISRGLAEKVQNSLRDGIPHLKKAMQSNPLFAPSIDPELLKRIYDDLVTESGADFLLGSQLCGVEMAETNRVDAVLIGNKAGLQAYKADIYIDCTGDGDLAAWAGAAFEKGDENGAMQPVTHCFIISNIDEYALANGPGIHFYDPESPIHKAIRSPAYPLIEDLHSCLRQIGPETYGFNAGHIYDVDCTSPEQITQALIRGRKMASQYRDAFAEFHPAFRNSYLSNSATLLGARESRRIIGDYMLTAEDYLEKRSFPDEICRNAYGIDVHGSKNRERESLHLDTKELIALCKKRNAEITQPLKPGESFGVPYRCLTPKSIENVLVAGRCISSDRRANGSVRIMACCLNTGEAAGIAAAMSTCGTGNIHEVNPGELRRKLHGYGAYLPGM